MEIMRIENEVSDSLCNHTLSSIHALLVCYNVKSSPFLGHSIFRFHFLLETEPHTL